MAAGPSSPQTPDETMDAFLYGDSLHYGNGGEALERWPLDKVNAAMMEINMRTDAQTLAHFYAGFGGIVRVARRAGRRDADG